MTKEQAPTASGKDWDEQARNWIAWARRPGHDSYWQYRDRFLAFVPAPRRATLDVGCGEGRVARDLRAAGHAVLGVDASPTLVAAARQADPDGDYRVADAAALPFEDGAVDLVVAYNSLMDVDDLPGSVAEASRVLSPGGRLVMAVIHPVTNTSQDGPYYQRRQFVQEIERDGLRMTFHSWVNPLGAYASALERSGLLIESMREPLWTNRDGTTAPRPFHLWLRAVRPG